MKTHLRRPSTKSKIPCVKWFKQWVPQDVATGGKCFVLKWVNEAELNALKDKSKGRELVVEPESTTEVLFLCSNAGCGKTFIDARALRKHSQIHGERQHVCHCGKAFSQEFSLKSHMKTHYPECGKSYAHEYTLKSDTGITSHHDKSHAQNATVAPPRYTTVGIQVKAPTRLPAVNCPYKGCKNTYNHPYRLYVHLRGKHPGHFPEEIAKTAQPCYNNSSYYYTQNEMAKGSDQQGHAGTRNVQRLNRPMPNSKLPPSNVLQQAVASLSNFGSMVKDEVRGHEEDNEEHKRKGMMLEWDGSCRYG